MDGMWPKTAHFESELDRLESWQATSVIKQKIFNPSKRLILCQQGVEKLMKEQQKY